MGPWGRLRQWLFMQDALDEACREDLKASPALPRAWKRARACIGTANSLLDSEEPPPLAPVLALYREALLCLVEDDRGLEQGRDASPQAMQAVCAPNVPRQAFQEQLHRCESLRLRLNSPGLVREVEDLRASLRDLLAQADAAQSQNRQIVQRKRRGRMGRATAVLLGVVALAVWQALPKDLARGKPWHTSSAVPPIYKAKLWFHTVTEPNPWFEVDLLRPTSVSRLAIRNRTDCCADRAVPLVIELSNDRSTWQQVARAEDPFIEWNPSFAPTRARYVRLRIPRLTNFHLEDVKIY